MIITIIQDEIKVEKGINSCRERKREKEKEREKERRREKEK